MLPRIAILRGNSCVREYGLPYASVISVARAVLEPVSSSTRAVRYGCVVPTEQTGRTRVADRTIFSRYCRALRSLCGLHAVYREFRAVRPQTLVPARTSHLGPAFSLSLDLGRQEDGR